jgi:hypothetical protein
MKISDFIKDASDSDDSSKTLVNLEEVEKTAELLESFSEEDSLLDDLAKLAVLQDVVGQNKKEFEKLSKYWTNNKK